MCVTYNDYACVQRFACIYIYTREITRVKEPDSHADEGALVADVLHDVLTTRQERRHLRERLTEHKVEGGHLSDRLQRYEVLVDGRRRVPYNNNNKNNKQQWYLKENL